MKILGGGGRPPSSPSDIGPKVADRREISHATQKYPAVKTAYFISYDNLCKLYA